jgi:hypothetical protein
MSFDIVNDLISDVRNAGEGLGKLAEDERAFALLVQSWRAQDRETFQDLLGQFGLDKHCNLVCDWICVTECSRLCFILCDPVLEQPKVSLPEFGKFVRELAAKPGMLEAAAAAVLEQDAETFRRVIDGLGGKPFCHLVCIWICYTKCHLVCRNLCGPLAARQQISCTRLVAELRQAAGAITALMESRDAMQRVEAGMLAGDYDAVRAAIQIPALQNRCFHICFFLMVWRCVRICLVVCRAFPIDLTIPPIRLYREFARELPRLGDQPENLRALILAMGKEDVGAIGEQIAALKLQRYCTWFCLWICRLWFRRFCIWLCPPVAFRPWFTHVGHFHIYGDIDGTTGRTNKAVLGHGGPDYAFFGCLELRGYCPAESPAAGGGAMRYRFLYESGGSRTPLVGDLVCPVIVGSRRIFWKQTSDLLEETFQTVEVRGSGATPDPTPTPAGPGPWGAPPTHVIVPDADGWITVDPQILGGGFANALIGFRTTTVLPAGDAAPGVAAGAQIPAGNLRNGLDLRLIFEATRVAGPAAPPDYTNTLDRIHVNNWLEAILLDLLQFHTGGSTSCTPLTSDLDIEYTVDHANMAAWSIGIVTAAPVVIPALPSGTATRGGGVHTAFDVHNVDISTWPTCSYAVQLTYRRALTTGLVDDDADTIQKTFCIGTRRP